MKIKGRGPLRRVVVEAGGPGGVLSTAAVTSTPPPEPRAAAPDGVVKGTRAPSTAVVGGGGGGSTLLRATLGEKLDAKGREPPTVDAAPESVSPQPNLYTSQLGSYAQLAAWIDQNLGNRDGIITVAELQKFVQSHGHDPRQHNGIIGIAMMLGVPTVQMNGVIQLANVQVQISAGGVQYREPQRTAPQTTRTSGLDPYATATSLVRQTRTADPYDVQQTIRSLAALPPTVLALLARRGTRVVVTAAITDYRPELQYQKPRGWPPGSTWSQPAGMHDTSRNEIVIARGGSGARVVAHEVGHALDAAAGWTRSNQSTFLKMYNADYNSLVRNGEHYLIQPGDAGPSEAFAESHAWFQTNPSWLRAAYPNLHAYWDWVAQNAWREVGG